MKDYDDDIIFFIFSIIGFVVVVGNIVYGLSAPLMERVNILKY